MRLTIPQVTGYTLVKIIYNVSFHPLSKFPGPILAAATQIPISVQSWNGNLPHWLRSLHDHYDSDIIRTSPNDISIISASAWKDIYGARTGMANFQKDRLIYSTLDSIITADDEYHSRIRRLVSHAFSDKALREQESLLMAHVNALIEGLKKESRGRVVVDLCDWFLWSTFDVIGDLSLGESFDCIGKRDYHRWVAMLMGQIKSIVMISVTKRFPPFQKLLTLYVPPKIKRDRDDQLQISFEKIDRRLNLETSRPDFVSVSTLLFSFILIPRFSEEKGGPSDRKLSLVMFDE